MTWPQLQALQSLWITGLFFWPYAYPALAGIVGETLPDLKGRFLEGASGVVRETKDAGLPNIVGEISQHAGYGLIDGSAYTYGALGRSGTFYANGVSGNETNEYGLRFDASNYNSIYGNSETVQPASYTVNYLIKAY